MISYDLEYEAPSTLEEAVRLLQRSPEAKVLAGGHSLIPIMKVGLAQPDLLVDLGRIATLRGIRVTDDALSVGALATHQDVADNATVRERLTALAEAAAAVGDLQVRGFGTIGGSLAHADSAADEPAPTLAFEATLRVVGPNGERLIPAREFFRGTFETALARDEILAEARFPQPQERTGSAYEKFRHPASGFAVVGVAAVVTLGGDGKVERAALGVTGAAEKPYRAETAERELAGSPGDDSAIQSATEKMVDGITTLSDLVASSEFRSHLVAVYARRALTRAIEKARSAQT
jgi:carbon-monoxide dehydrogenase medium subunit